MGLGAGEAHALDDQFRAQQIAAGAVHAQAALRAIDEAVAELQARAAAQPQRSFVGFAEYRHVGNRGIGTRQRALVAFAVVGFDGVVGRIRLPDVEILDAALPTVRPIQRIVRVAGEDDVFGIHRAAEELHAVIQIVVNLHVLHRRGRADALEGDAVQLILRIHVGTGEAHAHVAQGAGVVVAVGAAEQAGVGLALLGAGIGAAARALRAVVDGRVAVDHHAAPQAAIVVLGIAKHLGLGGEHDGLLRGAVRQQCAAALHDQEVLIRGADDHRAGGHFQLARRQGAIAARRCAGRRRDAQRAAADLEHHVVAEHHAGGIHRAAIERGNVDGADGAVAEGCAGDFAGIGEDAGQAVRNDGGYRGAVAGIAAISAIAAIATTTAATATIPAAASDRHLYHDGARRGVLGRTAAGRQQQRHEGQRTRPRQV